MDVSVNIWFLCFVIAAVCCCIHVCSVTGEIIQRKRRRRAKTTELKQLFSKNYLNSPGGFKVQPWISPFYTPRRPSGHIIAFYVQRARLKTTPLCTCIAVKAHTWLVNCIGELMHGQWSAFVELASQLSISCSKMLHVEYKQLYLAG